MSELPEKEPKYVPSNIYTVAYHARFTLLVFH
ncbi:hypothetical protein Xhom_04788 [Xenorhabdus hominickii]|uniref:Uncharacterized protein n=1 Tax=Xenorhabdus hominickii TaxID=351679 RepID=A0A1V0M4G6_XENHO|nr:hypothetical protein [Xenorhabdus hominickii]PHM51795.1 hypothetical protein Xhom_04788 [Xenorhabdus hominickii]